MDWNKMSSTEIALYLKAAEPDVRMVSLEQLAADPRKTVQNLVQRWQKNMKKAAAEAARMQALWQYETLARQQGYQWIAGTDEVGRGPLAGPVVAAAVILPEQVELPEINDSKKLSEKQREALDQLIRAQAVAYAIVEIDEKQIDDINILEASRLAMQEAVTKLSQPADFVLVDGLYNPRITVPSQAIIKGDSKSISIAAASILAKVHRDRLMVSYGQQYPQYGFEEHKGYPTAAHLEAVEQHGPCPLHRMSFKPLSDLPITND